MPVVVHKGGTILYLGNDVVAASSLVDAFGTGDMTVRSGERCSDLAKKALDDYMKQGNEVFAEPLSRDVVRLRDARLIQNPVCAEPLRIAWGHGWKQRNMSASLLSDEAIIDALNNGESAEVVQRYIKKYPKNAMAKRLRKILAPTTNQEDD